MIAMISTSTGLISGPGVKPNRPAPTPSTNMAVRMPSVAPRPSAVMMIAFAGRMIDPNTSAIKMNVATTM